MARNTEESTTFLLRNIPRDLWGKVKHHAFNRGISVRDLIIQLLRKEVITWRAEETEMEKSQKENLPSI